MRVYIVAGTIDNITYFWGHYEWGLELCHAFMYKTMGIAFDRVIMIKHNFTGKDLRVMALKLESIDIENSDLDSPAPLGRTYGRIIDTK